ncbi:MAG: GIY-YIG nuclease family protein [Parcubacteria group bacterium]|nr:GIY-YIG nuclease family protein [Parcubacteria group bacterium]
MFIVYILYSDINKKYYIGYTSNLEKRLHYHNSEKNKSTKSGIPWKVVKVEKYFSKKDAWLRERQIKRYKGGGAFKKLITTK